MAEIDGEDLEGRICLLTRWLYSAVRAICQYVTVCNSLAADLVHSIVRDVQDQDPDDGVE